jgi:guanyl-specific ribonuclease Sa
MAAGTRQLPFTDPDIIAEVNATLDRIASGGPHPHRQDGILFRNREGRLPARPPDYYREYTVATPGAPNRGARRIIVGQSEETYYTDDHYNTFAQIDPRRQ